MDIRFYTLDFSDVRILPETSKDNGYTSMNAEIEFRGNGKFELVFHDDEIEQFVREHPEGLLVIWGDFQGYLTDYQFKEKEKWVFGSHLNSLLHKFTIRAYSIDGDLQEAASNIITGFTPFVFVSNADGFGDLSFSTEGREYLDTFFIDLTEKSKIGYRLYIKNKVIYFELLKSRNNPLVLSKNNRNIYETQEDFSNKNIAYGGWYKKITVDADGNEKKTWTYISSEEKEGIFKQDVILNAETAKEAKRELAKYKSTYDITCKTRNIEYGVDYKLGDVIRYQTQNKTIEKQITSISLWHEKATYHEEPNLIDW